MARIEADREDLMREAVALVRRIELAIEGCVITAGYRAAGWLSVYFDADPMFQFDESGRLRRAFVDGLLYRTHGSVLAQLQRERTDAETTLVRHDLAGEPLDAFQQRMHDKIQWLHDRLESSTFHINRQIPERDSKLLPDILRSLDAVLKSPEFLAPAIR